MQIPTTVVAVDSSGKYLKNDPSSNWSRDGKDDEGPDVLDSASAKFMLDVECCSQMFSCRFIVSSSLILPNQSYT